MAIYHIMLQFIQNHSWFHAHDLKIIHICINTQWIFMFNVSISINFFMRNMTEVTIP